MGRDISQVWKDFRVQERLQRTKHAERDASGEDGGC